MANTMYTGGCHCGAVRFQVEADVKQAVSCNCSICGRMGWLLAFVPESNFELLSGEDALSDYQFNKKHIHHLFCRTCGIRSFGWGMGQDGQKLYSVNLRCLDDFDLSSVSVEEFDGKSL